ncbi:hypothetical protein HJ588_17560 [Flexivirga sp. ID2601S]|uniref:Restriction endonuclease type IV Mrr domain-containing protein n=1 Tax=Flexivirga aerilata TaxID=1656889 RepID=A0A849AL32_9MICO|nr:restriction endonuclease [Flexivirga aerilata]NNG41069.1 hypothetical protein [Flexivirga aerilata]
MIFDELMRAHGISTVPRAGLAMSHAARQPAAAPQVRAQPATVEAVRAAPAPAPPPLRAQPATVTTVTAEAVRASVPPPADSEELERVRHSLRQHRVALGNNLADVVGTLPGAAFGALVAELLRRTGFTVLTALTTTTSGSGSASEGLISRDPLGIDRLWLRAVQLPPRWVIDRSHLQGFVDAARMAGQEHGLLISTAVLTAEAQSAVAQLGAGISVIDGPRLIELMLQHDLGLAPELRVVVQRVDRAFFARL